HSLSYNFTIDPRPRQRQSWCEVQGQVDQKVFFSCDCGTVEIKYLSPLGEEVKRMNTWETQTDTLRDTGDLLKEQMPDVTPERYTDKGDGKLWLLFDLENGHWTLVHPGGAQMKEKWEKDRALTDFFKKVSMGDCRAWYQGFLVRWERMLKSTASPTTGPPTVHSSAPAVSHITWILPVVFISFIITVFLG
ncbi:hypothetical protein FD754_024705, partial [Muntiacus muntjak]